MLGGDVDEISPSNRSDFQLRLESVNFVLRGGDAKVEAFGGSGEGVQVEDLLDRIGEFSSVPGREPGIRWMDLQGRGGPRQLKVANIGNADKGTEENDKRQ